MIEEIASQYLLQRLESLPDGLKAHIERTRRLGNELAMRHSVDPQKVDVSILGHDLARACSNDELLQEAKRLNLRIHPVEREVPILLHGPIAAEWLRKEGSIDDPDIIEAITVHTTGRPDMSKVAAVVFLADKLEPSKASKRPELQRVIELANENLDSALLELLNLQLALHLNKRFLIHPDTWELRNQLLAANKRNPSI